MQPYAEKLPPSDAGFVIAAMFTPNFIRSAARLMRSLEALGLGYALFQVPSIHTSISPRGTDDLAHCKANFILRVMEKYQRPVLYLDADVVVRQMPARIFDCARGAVDFAIYNWLADDANDCYGPVDAASNRYWRFSHSLDFLDPAQLVCSGPTQYYACSEPARDLLVAWLNLASRYPRVPDDELLSYAFNSRPPANRINTMWLEKGYCRYPWWIQVRPIIDHPDFPTPASEWQKSSLDWVTGHQLFDVSKARKRTREGAFPRNYIVDAEEKCLLDGPEGKRARVRKFDHELWLSRDADGAT